MKVFVYGTLKRGYGNNVLLEGKRFLGEAITDIKFDMIAGGFPVIFMSDTGLPVKGEVFDVDDAETLHRLDGLEGEGRMYHRKSVPVTINGEKTVCAIYIGGEDFWSWEGKHQNERFTNPDGLLEWSR